MRIAALCLFGLMLLIYYAQGLAFQFWPDSVGYLAQAQGIAGHIPYSRPADRSAGYPALVAAVLATPAPAFVLVAVQGVLTGVSFGFVYFALTRLTLPSLLPDLAAGRGARGAVMAGVAAATLYSVVHVQIAALLTETLFTFLALVAVLAVVCLVLPERMPRRPWLEAAGASALVALPLLVKPHWQLVAPVLALVIGVALWRSVKGGGARGLVHWGLLAASLAVPLAIVVLVALPDRILAARHNARESALFGPRTAFCNHAHLLQATLQRRPALALDPDPQFASDLRVDLARLVASHSTGWRLLGFNGDLCTFDAGFSSLLNRRFPNPEAQRRFLLGGLVQAALSDPLPYARKVLSQMAHGFLTAFGRFAIHARPGVETYRDAVAAFQLPQSFAAGVRLAPEVGPLGSKATLDGTIVGRVVQGLLAVLFHAATVVLVVLALVSLLAPLWRWRTWDGSFRGHFLAFVAVPLVALLAHHALIALAHSFDVWRYGFNMFYVNLFFIGGAAMFWFADWRRWQRI